MVILSVDYGDVRTGIAVCDKFGMLASPVKVIVERDSGALADEITEIATEKKAEKIVLGLPKNMDGSEGFRAEACRQLAELISERINLPIDFEDERLTAAVLLATKNLFQAPVFPHYTIMAAALT